MFYFQSQDGSSVSTVALFALTCVFGKLDCFYRASAYLRAILIQQICLSVPLTVRPSVTFQYQMKTA